jgi:very-short-patch-repair endonuclease
LAGNGWLVLRFWNNETLSNTDAVMRDAHVPEAARFPDTLPG